MKTNLKKPLSVLALSKESSNDVLKHVLSPWEHAALQSDFKPFFYQFGKKSVYINPMVCKQLKTDGLFKLHLFTSVLNSIVLPLELAPNLKIFLHSPLNGCNLPTFLTNRLLDLDCKTVLDIVVIGRRKLSTAKGLGKQALIKLDAMFLQKGYSDLFK